MLVKILALYFALFQGISPMGPGPGVKGYAGGGALVYTRQAGLTEGFAGCTTGGTSSAINTTSVGAAGIIFVNIGSWSGDDPPTTPTDSVGNTYTLIQERVGGSARAQLYRVYNPTTNASHTFTVGGTGLCVSMTVTAFSRTGSGSASIQDSGQNDGSTPYASVSVTSTVADALIVTSTVPGSAGGGVTSVTTGYTVDGYTDYLASNYFGSGIAYKILAASGATTATWNLTNAGTGTVTLIAIAQ